MIKSIYDVFNKFPNEESGRKYFEKLFWNNKPQCPTCGYNEQQHKQKRDGKEGYYRCYRCKTVYTVRTGTIMERSHIGLHKWALAYFLVIDSRKGISARQLARILGINKDSAWFMLQRLREAFSDSPSKAPKKLQGEVEADEAHFGGKEGNKHLSKRLFPGGGAGGKTTVLGMRERGGRFKGIVLPNKSSKTIQGELKKHLGKDVTLYTDESQAYKGIPYNHKTVNHSVKQFVDGKASTNSVESIWALLKRGHYGIHHNISPHHLQKYVDEHAFRQNEAKMNIPMSDRLEALANRTIGKRLQLKDLKALNPKNQPEFRKKLGR